jgi:hypothetical protein
VSLSSVQELVFSWVGLRLQQKEAKTLPEFVSQQVSELIQDHTIVRPVHGLMIQSPFELGMVTLKPVTGEAIERWIEEWGGPEASPEAVSQATERVKRRMQGFGASWYSLNPDPAHGD